jgi:hypothetical protein
MWQTLIPMAINKFQQGQQARDQATQQALTLGNSQQGNNLSWASLFGGK